MPLGMCVNWLWEASKFSRLWVCACVCVHMCVRVCGCVHVYVYICVCGHANISYHIMCRLHFVCVHCRCDMCVHVVH